MDGYDKVRILGRGAHGVVHLARRKKNSGLVVLKEICVDNMAQKEKEQTLTEIEVLAMFNHPNIVKYYDSFIQDSTIVIVMGYAPGGNLSQYLQQNPDNYLEEKEVLHLFSQILLGLHCIHSCKVLHRDLKPQNILLNAARNIAMIGDFGISKILTEKTQASTSIGTPCYISPECWKAQPYNYKSDIWALGCVFYELMMKKPAFEGETVPALMLNISQGKMNPILGNHYSKDMKQLLEEMLQIDPDDRSSTAQLMAHPLLVNPVINLYTDIGMVTPDEPRPSTVITLPPVDLKSRKFFKFFSRK